MRYPIQPQLVKIGDTVYVEQIARIGKRVTLLRLPLEYLQEVKKEKHERLLQSLPKNVKII